MESPKIAISNQVEAIQYFIMKMDIEMIDSILDNGKTYQEFQKYIFISKLQKAFEKFRSVGDTHLIAFEGKCNSCDKNKRGFTFVGNNSSFFINMIFVITKNQIIDLYECSMFKNKSRKIKLEEQVFIDLSDIGDLETPF